jgi:hypothetical protein
MVFTRKRIQRQKFNTFLPKNIFLEVSVSITLTVCPHNQGRIIWIPNAGLIVAGIK